SAMRNDLHVETHIKAVLDTLLAGSTDYDALTLEAWAKTHRRKRRCNTEAEQRGEQLRPDNTLREPTTARRPATRSSCR
ncbi:MAG: hypothetical protein ACKOFW_07430, partial [Planctomycetaceae bacterium]